MTEDIIRTETGMWRCPICTSEWSSPMSAAACMEDDTDRHNTRGYD